MKPFQFTGCLLFALLPALAAADGKRPNLHSAETDAAVSWLPVAVDNTEARSAASLRDSLRQPHGELGGSQPYRLSTQERQRMRDQLRAQSPRESTRN
jgi:hypothetical protein